MLRHDKTRSVATVLGQQAGRRGAPCGMPRTNPSLYAVNGFLFFILQVNTLSLPSGVCVPPDKQAQKRYAQHTAYDQ